jgi:hypothetical protein
MSSWLLAWTCCLTSGLDLSTDVSAKVCIELCHTDLENRASRPQAGLELRQVRDVAAGLRPLFFFFFFFLNSAPYGFGLDTSLAGSPYYAKQPRVFSPKPRERMLLRTPSYVAVWGSRLLEQCSQCHVFRQPYTH